MLCFRAVQGVVTATGRVIQDTICAMGQRVAVSFESISDSLAEKRYRASHRARTSPPLLMVRVNAMEGEGSRGLSGQKHPN